MLLLTKPIPLSLYIHIPWCVRKCPYCDFNSHVTKDIPEELYVSRLIESLDTFLPLIWNRNIISIFFGGGTPSLFSPKSIEKILTLLHSRLRFSPQAEITLEANPGTVDAAHFIGFKQAGINRLSLGLQSLQNDKLQKLGRIHDRDQALRAIECATASGFENFNLDIMHGLPGQTLEDALQDIKDALAFQPTHFSWYQLTIEPNTFFHHQPPVLPDEDQLWEIQEQGKNELKKSNYSQYEVSAYAKIPCVHNLNYWEFGDYLGIGAGAHSKITDMGEGKIIRFFETKNPKDYLNNVSYQNNFKILSEQDLIFEFMLNALRLTQGVPLELFTERTGLSVDLIKAKLEMAKSRKLLVDSDDLLCATSLGQQYLNDLVGEFLGKTL